MDGDAFWEYRCLLMGEWVSLIGRSREWTWVTCWDLQSSAKRTTVLRHAAAKIGWATVKGEAIWDIALDL